MHVYFTLLQASISYTIAINYKQIQISSSTELGTLRDAYLFHILIGF